MFINNGVAQQIIECEASDWEADATGEFRPRKTVERVAEVSLPPVLGEFRLIGCRSLTSNEEFVVLTRGVLRSENQTLVNGEMKKGAAVFNFRGIRSSEIKRRHLKFQPPQAV